MVHTTCAVRECKSSSRINKELRFHQFPHSVERCKLWVQACSRPDLVERTSESLKYTYICSLHFERRMYGKKSLKKTATPTLLLPITNTGLADQCRFCGQFSKDCIIVSTRTPYLSGHRTTLALNVTSVQLDFNGALPNTVCQDCDAKLKEIADFVKVVKDAQELINVKIKTECEEVNDMIEIDSFIKTEVDTESDAVSSISISDTVFTRSVSHKAHKIKSDTNQKAKVSKPNVTAQCANVVYIKQEIDEELESSRLSHSDTRADSGTWPIPDELKRTFYEIAVETCVNEVSRKKTKISDSETV